MSSAAEIVADRDGGFLVMADGQPQSYVDLADPGLLVFEYVQQLAMVLDALPAGRLRVTHVGGAGLTLPRYLAHVRPGSPQIVFEPDGALTALVRRELPLPRGHKIRVRELDGRTGLRGLTDRSADVVVIDAYAAGRIPADLTSSEAMAEVARVLDDCGIALWNVADEPDHRFLARVVATATSTFAQVATLAMSEVAKGRRFGNTVIVAGSMLPEAQIRRAAAGSALPTTISSGAALSRLARSATALMDAEGVSSPPPPDPGRWRVR